MCSRLPAATLLAIALLIAGTRTARPGWGQPAPPTAAEYAAQRTQMVAREIEAAGVKDPRVLDAMRKTPRHEFMPAAYQPYAYVDAALPIGERQTISPPFVVAYMTEQLNPQPTDRVLEIGTGSGYQAAVLSPLVKDVYTIEIVEPLGRRAARTLKRLGYQNVHAKVGDGYKGWPDAAPFDKIIVTCSPESVPQPLVDQLRNGGEMIIPVGERYQQNLVRMTKRAGKLTSEPLQATLFVPMTGAAEDARQVQPDPLHPTTRNGSFEEVVGQGTDPLGWHYLRQATTVQGNAGAPAPHGSRWLRFTNADPGVASQALQGMAIDGRKVSQLKISCQVRAEKVVAGPGEGQLPAVVVSFYDERRAVIETVSLGPWSGTFGWKEASGQFRVPLATREAIIRIGLGGATGRLDFDDLQLHALAATQ
ncbi:protein-L-isoaspartate(D-aspartate) O-methyltransferase [Lacipirellula limnantheis]|uniref:Protein-L-isoaspartate O-methyltransferase n=1 Tax=Lacipirellula limnantheis TaxID=2528024 RepID=A0A517U2R4_9BACT|nr:protein-L-isoaspartate(D-aspartate) O-methyltransferase [Lacipirellula limnantheis]QDT74919.1 Protein-L-isoaspartate O-methyltransferase [Lacipirellula limnantheis]